MWFAIAERYRHHLKDFKYARGANALGCGKTLNLTCDQDKEICVYKATQICSIPGVNNHEMADSIDLEPISGGHDSPYGSFNPHTTTDLTKDMGKM